MKKLTLSVAALSIALMSYGQSTQCKSMTKDSIQCKNKTKTEVKLCHLHNKNYTKKNKVVSVICKGTTKKGKNCKNKTKNKNNKCHLHGGKKD